MSNRLRSIPIMFLVTSSEKQKIIKNMKRSKLGNMGNFMRALGLSNVRITVNVGAPKELYVKDLHLGHIEEEGRDEKRATG